MIPFRRIEIYLIGIPIFFAISKVGIWVFKVYAILLYPLILYYVAILEVLSVYHLVLL